MNADACRAVLWWQAQQTINYLVQASKKPYGPFGAKPIGASVFINVSVLSDADALAGTAKPARAPVSIIIDTLMEAAARASFAPKGP